MSRVFEAMRRLNATAPETSAAPAEVLETFLLEAVRPSVVGTNEPLSTPAATLWLEPALPTGNPADKRTARESKREKMARSFDDLLREIARDEQEQG